MAKPRKYNPWLSRVAALGAVALATPLLLAGIASADTVDLDSGKSGNAGSTFGPAGGDASFLLKLVATDGSGSTPDVDGCNASGTNPVTVTFTTDDSWAEPPAPVALTGCGTPTPLTVAIAAGTPVNSSTKLHGVATSGAPGFEVTSSNGSQIVPASEFNAGFITVHVRAVVDGEACAGATAPAAPVISTADGTPGDNGWWKAAPTIMPESGVTFATSTDAGVTVGNYSATPPSLSEGSTVVYAVATNACGLSSTASSTFLVDGTPPVIVDTGYLSGTAGSNGWYTSDVANRFTVTDAVSGLAVGTSPIDKITSGAGSGRTVSSGTVTDIAGNTAAAVTSQGYNVDLDDPSATLDAYNASQSFGNVATPRCTGTDPTPGSGVASCLVTGVLTTIGDHVDVPLTLTVTDVAGRSVTTSSTATYRVTYANGSSGACFIRQPIACDQVSVFSRGKSIPVKFGLLYDETTTIPAGGTVAAGFSTANWTVAAVPAACSVGATPGAAVTTLSNQGGALFRYDPSGDQYVFNADMSKQAVSSCWRFKVTLDDGSAAKYSAVFKLQK